MRKIDRILDTDGREDILELVHQPAQSVSMTAQTGGDSGASMRDKSRVTNTALRGRRRGHSGRESLSDGRLLVVIYMPWCRNRVWANAKVLCAAGRFVVVASLCC